MKYTAGSSDDGNESYDYGCVEVLHAEPAEKHDGVEWSNEICTRCGDIPWYWSQLKDGVVRKVDEDACCGGDAGVGNNLKRDLSYRLYTYESYAFMSKRRRVVLPICVMAGIRDIWPDKYGSYMGFHED